MNAERNPVHPACMKRGNDRVKLSHVLLATSAVIAMTTDLSEWISSLNSPEEAARCEAAEHLARLGPDAQAAAVGLVRACSDQSEQVLESVVAALEELGPPPTADLEALAALAGHENTDTAYWAITLLGRLRGDAAPAVGALSAVLSNSTKIAVRQRAAWALGKIGPSADDAIDALRRASADDDPRLARLAQRAIEQIRP